MLEGKSQNIYRSILHNARERPEPPRLPGDLIRLQEVFFLKRRVHWDLLPWRLIPLDLPPQRLTQSPRIFLADYKSTPVYIATRGLDTAAPAGVTSTPTVRGDQSRARKLDRIYLLRHQGNKHAVHESYLSRNTACTCRSRPRQPNGV